LRDGRRVEIRALRPERPQRSHRGGPPYRHGFSLPAFLHSVTVGSMAAEENREPIERCGTCSGQNSVAGWIVQLEAAERNSHEVAARS
jgi:hypothetical protein